MSHQRGHVVELTYPAQCHISPLQFAKCLASKVLKATLATTHYTMSIHATTVGVEPISDGYDEGGFKSVGPKTIAELISKFKDSASPVTALCMIFASMGF